MNNKKTKKAPTTINEFKAEVKKLKSQLRILKMDYDDISELRQDLIISENKLKYENARLENRIAQMHFEQTKKMVNKIREDQEKVFNSDLDRYFKITEYLILKSQQEKNQSQISGFDIPLDLVATWENDSLKN